MTEEKYGEIVWFCRCCNNVGEEAWVNALEDVDCQLCHTKRPKELDSIASKCTCGPEFDCGKVAQTIPRGFSVDVLEVVDTPLGPGWYWYKHDVTVDAACMEIGLKGNDLIAIWKGLEVDIKQLTGKWQRVCPSAFHLPKADKQ